jgi:osmotically inducible protein OsmC
MRVTWKARAEEHGEGLTSPEELIAAAHATCYSMAFSNILAKAGTPPTALDTEATATFVPGEGITSMELTVRGTVDGISEVDFLAAAETARENCPVSKALQGNVPITLNASLA